MFDNFQSVAAGSSVFPLPGNELHVWRASLASGAETLEGRAAALQPDEIERAKKFLVPGARSEFVTARSILRELLALYLGQSAATAHLSYGPRGKPRLAWQEGGCSLQFNLSHSHGLAAFVFARHKAVGIDIERIRRDFGGEEIADLHFSKEEAAELRRLPEGLRAAGFFKCWTRKEAYLKARGDGLQLPLSSFQVSMTSDDPQELFDEAGSRWSLYPFEPAEGFTGAVAGQGGDAKLRFWEWPAGSPSLARNGTASSYNNEPFRTRA